VGVKKNVGSRKEKRGGERKFPTLLQQKKKKTEWGTLYKQKEVRLILHRERKALFFERRGKVHGEGVVAFGAAGGREKGKIFFEREEKKRGSHIVSPGENENSPQKKGGRKREGSLNALTTRRKKEREKEVLPKW